MTRLDVNNPFGAPVYYKEMTGSTMNDSRILCARGEPHGTVIAAGFQSAGRGRIRGRPWDVEKNKSLLFTVLLRWARMEDIPAALPLRAGLAAAFGIEDFCPALVGKLMIKWPNDILAPAEMTGSAKMKKLVGILAEAERGNVHLGMGINVSQTQFPPPLQDKAASICIASGREIHDGERFTLLEKIILHIYNEIEAVDACTNNSGWISRVTSRLYKKGEEVRFARGGADSGDIVTGILSGIGPGGELLIHSYGKDNFFTAGELLDVY
jgi:BirA family biotin operon repressor/biotin-[acetyl-CoA-carboxylase] ligase